LSAADAFPLIICSATGTKEDMMAHALGIRERMKDRDKEDRLAAKVMCDV
jgi:hypothetical protein